MKKNLQNFSTIHPVNQQTSRDKEEKIWRNYFPRQLAYEVSQRAENQIKPNSDDDVLFIMIPLRRDWMLEVYSATCHK